VGKSGLALRLAADRFKPTISTDASWASQLKLPHNPRTGDIEREIWLWDFGGQADYRLIHQLFMDETALAVLVFNPQVDNPFEGLGQWDRELHRAARRPFQKLLVAGRCDRGGLTVSRDSIEQFCMERGFACFVETSANTGAGCDELRRAIVKHIAWKEIPWTASPRLFKLLKDEIVKLKKEDHVLLRMGELKQQLEMKLLKERFTLDELRAVVGLLAGPGIVRQLEFGDFILLQPERLNAYASAVIRSVRAHTDEIGVIPEERVLAGDLDYQDMRRLPPDEEQIVLRAMHQTFVDRGLCLREHTERGPQLVFPSYFRRERPELEGHPAIFVTYQFGGQLDEIYATLVVRLYYTAFDKDRLWRFAADFKTPQGKRAGLKMTKKSEGAAEITVYFEPTIPDDTKVTFMRYVHEHLKAKALNVTRVRHYVCRNPRCGEPVESTRAIKKALERKDKHIPCQFCHKPIPLFDLIEERFASEATQQRVSDMEKQALATIDNESRELILVGHAFVVAGEAGQIFRQTPNSDWGIDGEIEFKNYHGQACGQRVYLQLKSGDYYLTERKKDGTEVFQIKNARHADYWLQQAYPVMLVTRASDGVIRWMDVSAHLKAQSKGKKSVKNFAFKGEPFTALNVQRLKDHFIPLPG
jgi:GTPase SAR1 family protein